MRADAPPGHLDPRLHFGPSSCLQGARPCSELATALVGGLVCEWLAVGTPAPALGFGGPHCVAGGSGFGGWSLSLPGPSSCPSCSLGR